MPISKNGMTDLKNCSMKQLQIKPELIIIAGPNGSGKTSVTKRFLHHEWAQGTIYINPDEVAQQMFGDWNSHENVLKAAKYCAEWREQCLQEKKSFVFETVMSTDEKVEFILRAKRSGYFIRLFFIATEAPTINASRIAGRVMEGGHDVPISKIISRYYKSIQNCRFVADKVDRLYVYDNSVDGKEAELQFRLVDGNIKKKYMENVAEWTKAILVI